MGNRYKELGCQRCKNRLRSVKSKQGEYCSEMIKSDKSSCLKFKLDRSVVTIKPKT